MESIEVWVIQLPRKVIIESTKLNLLVFVFQACFLGFECAMKFLDWLAPDLRWRLTVTPECESPGTELSNAAEFFAVQTRGESKTNRRFFFLIASFHQRIDYEWNPAIPYVDHSEQKRDASEPAPKHTIAYTHAHRQSNVLTPFLFYLFWGFFYLFSLCCFYI